MEIQELRRPISELTRSPDRRRRFNAMVVGGDSMRSGIIPALIVALVIASASRVVLADCLIVEAHVGERPLDADEILEPFKEPLKAIGCRDAREVVQGLEKVSRPGMQVDPDTLKKYEHDVNEGLQKYRDGDYKTAIELLGPLVTTAENNPAAFVGQPGLRSSHRLALVGISMAHRKRSQKAESQADAVEALARSRRRKEAAELLNQATEARARAGEQMERAKELMGSVVRTFGTREIQRSEFGGETFDFYEQVKKELHAGRKAEMTFRLDDRSGVLYVNGEYADVGEIDMKLLPGPNTILIRWGSGPNAVVRFYRYVLQRYGYYLSHTTRRFEEILHTGPDWCCMLYPSTASLDWHLKYDIVRFGSGNDRIVVMGIHPGTKSSPRSVVGQVHGLGRAAPTRRVRVLLQPTRPPRQHRVEVGRYWADQRDDLPDQSENAAAWARSVGAPLSLKLSLAGVGLASGIVGGYLGSVRGACGMALECPRATQISGGLLMGVGALALGTAIYFEVRDRRRLNRVNRLLFSVQRDSISVGWAWSYP
jgi:hypothetical protein